ncbi:ATP-binding cassette domain-containing protein [Sinosporangium siamense]|uniref:ABC transporter ATP-binding protein n=1 Tax=Sinosporangium siamense TaxID=1367973 RepID=A0A919RGT4_9ACTN|nr:ABC transporter ATP-binding protein [Sinosporangium siamense]GII91691.1 ABC transporter ATP-binding protein [Sinosporangium siamense]
MRAADRLLAGLIRGTSGWTTLLAVSSLITAGAELALPLALGAALDNALDPQAGSTGFVLCALLVGLAVIGEVLSDLGAGVTRVNVIASVRHRLIGHILGAGPAVPRRFGTGDLVARATGGADETGHAPPAVVLGVAGLIPALGSMVLLFLIDYRLGLTFLIGSACSVLLLRAFVKDASELVTAYQRVQGGIAARLLEALAGARTIAAARTGKRECARVLAPLPELRAHGDGMWRVQRGISVKTAVSGPLTEIAVIAVAGICLTWGDVSAGDVVAASRYAALGGGIGGVLSYLNRLARARGAAVRIAEVLGEPLVEYGSRLLPEAPARAGTLEFKDVAAAGVLHKVNMTVPGGLTVALVGSGAEVSLAAALAGRLADPDAGEITLDGVPLPALGREALRRAVGYAFERPALLGGTLRDAIALRPDGMPLADEDMRAAARAACAEPFILRLPQQYDTEAAEAPMSGGEAQRLGLARAFAHPGRLLVFDDATSSLDTVTELQVSQAIVGELGGRTRLIVAHRAATAARADLVVWLHEGRARASGPHERLWRDPDYRAVFAAGPSSPSPDEASADEALPDEAFADGGAEASPRRVALHAGVAETGEGR